MADNDNRRDDVSNDEDFPSWVPGPFRLAAARLGKRGIGLVFKEDEQGRGSVRLINYQHGFEDDEVLLRNAASLPDDEWEAYLRPTQAWLVAAPDDLRERGDLMLVPIEFVRADNSPCPAWVFSPERADELLSSIRGVISTAPIEVPMSLIDFAAPGADLDMTSLTLTFDEGEEQAHPILAAVFRAWLPAHPFSDPQDLILAADLTRDVGHGRRLLISGDILTAGDAPRLINRHDMDAVIEELREDYDLTDPVSATNILGEEASEEIADYLLMEGGEDGPALNEWGTSPTTVH